MSFWSTNTIKQRFPTEKLIKVYSENGRTWNDGYDPSRVLHGSYELALGPEVYVTSDLDGRKRILKESQQVVIPPGQFALLLTEERIEIPVDSMGLISIKAGKKFCGLVNVSGFHVDPGYKGRLKFSVYNAGSRDVILTRGKALFVLWLARFDANITDIYPNKNTQDEITDDDVMKIQGEIASPGNLLSRLQEIEKFISMAKITFTTILIALGVTILGGLVVNGVWDKFHPKEKPPVIEGSKDGKVK